MVAIPHNKDCTNQSTLMMKNLTHEDGSVEIEFCDSCGVIINARCNCEKCHWLDMEAVGIQVLICDLCGRDNT